MEKDWLFQMLKLKEKRLTIKLIFLFELLIFFPKPTKAFKLPIFFFFEHRALPIPHTNNNIPKYKNVVSIAIKFRWRWNFKRRRRGISISTVLLICVAEFFPIFFGFCLLLLFYLFLFLFIFILILYFVLFLSWRSKVTASRPWIWSQTKKSNTQFVELSLSGQRNLVLAMEENDFFTFKFVLENGVSPNATLIERHNESILSCAASVRLTFLCDLCLCVWIFFSVGFEISFLNVMCSLVELRCSSWCLQKVLQWTRWLWFTQRK